MRDTVQLSRHPNTHTSLKINKQLDGLDLKVQRDQREDEALGNRTLSVEEAGA